MLRSQMIHQTYSWKSKDLLEYSAHSLSPMGPSKGVVCLVHGMGDHSLRYTYWAEMFVESDFSFLSMDFRGHGKSAGKRGHSPSYGHLMDDVELLLTKAAEIFPNLPVILYGQSMGGNLVINYALRRRPNIHCMIATSPWFRLVFSPPAVKLATGKLVKSIAPGLLQSTGLNTLHLSHDPLVVEKYKMDELVHDRISAGMFFGIYGAGLWALEHAEGLEIPTLLMHGSDDQITSPQASIDFHSTTNNVCDLKIWRGCYHELHNEPEKDKVFDFILDWLTAKGL